MPLVDQAGNAAVAAHAGDLKLRVERQPDREGVPRGGGIANVAPERGAILDLDRTHRGGSGSEQGGAIRKAHDVGAGEPGAEAMALGHRFLPPKLRATPQVDDGGGLERAALHGHHHIGSACQHGGRRMGGAQIQRLRKTARTNHPHQRDPSAAHTASTTFW